MKEKFFIHITKFVKSIIFNMLNKKYSKCNQIYLFTDGRGGGTWLMEMIADACNAITIFEPFSGRNFGYIKRFKKYSYPFCPSDEAERLILHKFLNDVERLNNPGFRALMFNSFNRIFEAKNVVYKFVNKNFILSDFIKIVKPENKIILMLRNPIDVLQSRKAYGYKDLEMTQKFDWSKIWRIHDSHPLTKHVTFLDSLQNVEQLYVAEWCASVSEIFDKEELMNRIILIQYYELKENPNGVIENVLKQLDMFYDISKINATKKSFSTTRIIKNKNKQEDIRKEDFNFIFDYFGIGDLFKNHDLNYEGNVIS
jgi:hypothetical protein